MAADTRHPTVDLILTAGGIIGAITGAATIFGWITQLDLLSVAAEGFPILGLVLLVVVSIGLAVGVVRGETRTEWLATVLCLYGGCVIAWFLDGREEGLGVIFGAAGIAWCGVGVWAGILRFAKHARTRPAVKTCPECAETVKAAARVCRFCGHRFGTDGDTRA